MPNELCTEPEKYIPLVVKTIDRMDINLPSHWDRDDMISYGILGLFEAVERFKPEKGVKFSTFAVLRIRGAVIDALRKEAPVSREKWSVVRRVTDISENLFRENGKEPKICEIAEIAGIPESKITEALGSIKLLSNISLERTLDFDDNNNLTIGDTIASAELDNPLEIAVRKENTERLALALEKIGERHRTVLSLYYYEELGIRDIAEIMEVSVSRISQIKTMALLELRKILKEDSEDKK